MDLIEMKDTASSSRAKIQDESSRAIVPASITSALPISCGQQRRRIISHQSSSCEQVLDTANLLQEILIKLPWKTVFGCTSVSKHWNKVITDSQIIRYLKFSRNPTAVFLRRLAGDHRVVNFTHISLAGVTRDGERHKNTTVSLNFFRDEVPFVINHSSNGLMICSSYAPICFFLYNPTTMKHTRIPRPIQVEVISMNIAFQAPVPYKIVAVCRSRNIDGAYQVQVLVPNQTIMHWRNTRVNFPVFNAGDVVNFQYGVCIDGVIYWPCYLSTGLLLFNVSEETLVWLPKVPQPDDALSGIAYFGECKGKLCMVKCSSMRWAMFDMLELKTDHSMWFIKHRIDLRPRARLANPVVPLTIPVLALLPGDEEEDDIGDSYLIVHILNEVISYNFKDHTMKKLCDLGLGLAEAYALRTEP